MRVKHLVSLAIAAGAVVAASSASAAIVSVSFAGTLNRSFFGGRTGAFSGTATYDTASEDTSQALQPDVLTDFSLTSPIFNSLYGSPTIAKSTFAGSTGDVNYFPLYPGDTIGLYELVFHIANAPHARLTLDLGYAPALLPSGYGLPSSLPPLSSAAVASSRLDNDFGEISLGSITSFTMTSTTSAAPEPATWALSIVGFGAAGAAIRRRPGRGTTAAAA